jgi:outer membrane protein
MSRRMRWTAALCATALACAQQPPIGTQPKTSPVFLRPFEAAEVPPIRLSNSPRLQSLMRAGVLYLTARDAIALALENNIDIEIARYNPEIASWNVVRAEAGGALPGVPSNASQAGAVAAGQGVTGSQAAAGVRITGVGANAGQTANATITQIGPVTQTLDPILQEASTFSHTSVPQPNVVQSAAPVLITDTRATNGNFQQGLLSGGSITSTFTNNFLKENSPSDLLNPSSAPNLSLAVQHNLLRGFGNAVNGRTIRISKINARTSDVNFKTQVVGVVTRVLNLYYGLVTAGSDLKAKRNAVDVAQTFLNNLKQEVAIGSAAEIDLVPAQTQLASSQQALADSEASLEQQEVQLKNLLSRTGTADPLLSSARIVPIDRIVIPEEEDLPPFEDMVKQALANRPDLAAERANFEVSQVSALGTRNGILPSLMVFGASSNAGLAGQPHTVVRPDAPAQAPDPYFAGGIGTGLGQVFRRNFPTERVGAFYQSPIHNTQAQADFLIDQLQLRQTELTTQKDLNQVEVVVRNWVVGLQQARARYEAAAKNRALQEALLDGEQKKFQLGSSTPYNVIQAQRDLATAQSAELAALVAYSTAKVALDQALGSTLEANGISISEAREGRVRGH